MDIEAKPETEPVVDLASAINASANFEDFPTSYSRAAATALAAIFIVLVLFLVFTLPPRCLISLVSSLVTKSS